MRVMTILGTRPEIIRLSRVIPLLDSLCDHVLVHTGQNFDPALSDIFFEELGVRQPDHLLGIRETSPMAQVGAILAGCGELIERERPDRLLLLGDTNSALSAFAARRAGVAVYHMEAGNRCYDDRVPEEVEQSARCVLSDSGTVQEECCIFHVPNVTLRDVTERPETLEAGSNMLSGGDPESILSCVRTVLRRACAWSPPAEYLASGVSATVARIVLGHRRG